MPSKLLLLFAMCALICRAATHLDKIRSTSYGGYAVLPIWTEDFGMSYLVNITIGSDNQTLPLVFDTASPDTFLNPDCFTLSNEATKRACLKRTRYNAFSSATSKFSGGSFSLIYEGGWGEVAGTYISDDINIGSTTINAKHVGLIATSRSFSTGLFGAGRSVLGEEPSIIEQMVAQGHISSCTFSIDLGPLDDAADGTHPTGTVILGGIDTKRYKGSLTMLEGTGYNTYLTAMGLTLPNGTSITYYPILSTPNNKTGLPVFLDSGSEINIVPETLVEAISDTYPQISSRGGSKAAGVDMIVPCDAAGGTFDYTFVNLTIRVPFSDSVTKRPDGTCVLPFSSRSANDNAAGYQAARPFVLGNNVMRAAYVFYDLDAEHIWMGERANCGSEIVATGKGVEMVEGCCIRGGKAV